MTFAEAVREYLLLQEVLHIGINKYGAAFTSHGGLVIVRVLNTHDIILGLIEMRNTIKTTPFIIINIKTGYHALRIATDKNEEFELICQGDIQSNLVLQAGDKTY